MHSTATTRRYFLRRGDAPLKIGRLRWQMFIPGLKVKGYVQIIDESYASSTVLDECDKGERPVWHETSVETRGNKGEESTLGLNKRLHLYASCDR
jgi:hypothetical protein